MWTIVVVAITAILAVAWVPIGIHFWRAWKLRGAPLSLAICGLVGFQIYLNSGTWLFFQNDPRWVSGVVAVGNLAILLNFWLCFKWQKIRFPDERINTRAPSDADTNPRYRPKG